MLRGLRHQHGTAKNAAPLWWTSDLERVVAATLAEPALGGD